MARVIVFLSLVVLISCNSEQVEDSGSGSGWNYDTVQSSAFAQVNNRDYTMEFATGFAVQEYQGNRHVIIFDDSTRVAEYMLYKGDEPEPIAGVQNVKVPIQSIACLSTTYLPYIDRLGKASSILGVANADFVKNFHVREQINIGFTRNISADVEIDLEKVIEINPDLLMVYPFNSPDYSRLQKMGIDLFYNTEYKETHPLGQVEWIKLFGLLYDREQAAFDLFEEVKASYFSAVEIAAALEPVPIMAGSIFNDKWSAPGGKSMGARLISDAGGHYIWDDNSTGSYSKDLETAIEDSEKAEILALVSSFKGEFSRAHLVADNPKYQLLKPYNEGRVIHCNTAKVNYFEDALLEPDLILKDLVHLFHPEQLPNHNLKYFRLLK